MEVLENNRHVIVSILLLLSLSVPAAVSAAVSRCQEGREFLTEDQICCDKCPPGFKLTENCRGPNHKTNCSLCPAGQFMDKINYFSNCFLCKRCKGPLEIEVSRCQPKKDAVCRCIDGYYKYNIDKQTSECRKCSTCKNNERQTQKCSPDSNTVCDCKENYYRVNKKCQPCTNCTKDCPDHCPRKEPTTDQPDTSSFVINVIAGVVVALVFTLVLVIVVTHCVTKRQTKRKLLSSSEFKETPKIYQELTVHHEEPLNQCVQAVSLHVMSHDSSNLPDCVPLEIKMVDVIYFLLDAVPVLQVKQLVRSLGVSDTVIERAELDHRSSKEAHYQMLKAWAEQRSVTCRGGGQVLHLPQLQELLDKLRRMYLEQTAEELEAKFNLL